MRAGATLPARLRAAGFEETAEHLSRLARLDLDGAGHNGADVVASVSVPHGSVEILAGDALDLGAARRRLEERRDKLREEIERSRRKLANQGFVAKAPPAVVEAEREKQRRLQAELEAL